MLVFLITPFAKRISRSLELANWVMVGTILVGLLLIDLFIVPFELWWEGIRGFFTPAAPPAGHHRHPARRARRLHRARVRAQLVRDGPLPGQGLRHGLPHRLPLRAARRGSTPCATTASPSPTTTANAARWRRWYRLLLADLWGVFFIGAMLGMLLPTILMAHAVELSGQQPTTATVPTFVASALGAEYGRPMFYIALLIGVLILFSTQLGIFEAMVRVTTDAAHANSPRLRRLIEGDPRRFYFPFMFILLVVISIILHLALPVNLVQWSANMSNLGALIFPFLLIYLNSRLPRSRPPEVVALRAAAGQRAVLRLLLRQLHRRLLRRPAGHLLTTPRPLFGWYQSGDVELPIATSATTSHLTHPKRPYWRRWIPSVVRWAGPDGSRSSARSCCRSTWTRTGAAPSCSAAVSPSRFGRPNVRVHAARARVGRARTVPCGMSDRERPRERKAEYAADLANARPRVSGLSMRTAARRR